MISASQLREMPANHEFAKGEIELPDLTSEQLRYVCKWSGRDWSIRVAPARHSFQEVSSLGKIIDVEKYIKTIQPCDPEAYKLYMK